MKKEKLISSIIVGLIGILLFSCSILGSLEISPFNLILKGINLGFISGFGGGLIGIGIARIVQYVKLKNNPEALKELEISMHDERNIQISQKAGDSAFRITALVMCISCIILMLLRYNDVSILLGFFLCAFCVLYKILYTVYQRKM